MSIAETVTVNENNVRALVLGGILEPCAACVGVKESLQEFCRHAKFGTVLTFPNREDQGSTAVVINYNTAALVEVLCPQCCNTGWVPTQAGKALLWLVQVWLEKVTPEWKRGLDEIPF